MYRIKEKRDAEGNKYYKIQKKFFIFWVTILEYGNHERAKEVLSVYNHKLAKQFLYDLKKG